MKEVENGHKFTFNKQGAWLGLIAYLVLIALILVVFYY